MNVLITGGAGYIGSRLTELLLEKDYKVTILDNFMYNQTSLIHLCNNKKLKIVNKDVTDLAFLKTWVPDYDVIIPLAAIVGAPACDRYPELASEVNYRQIKAIVDSLGSDQKLIMPNTNSQYGNSDSIITEESEFKPLSLYAQTKCNAENYILRGGNGICLRLATVFGSSPRMRTDLLVNDFVYRAMADGFLVLYEAHYKRNYIHVMDVARTFLWCIDNYEKMNNDVFNVGLSDANLSKGDLAVAIKNFFPDLLIVEEDFKKDLDQRNYLVSNEKLEKTGWLPKYTIDDGITELIKAYEMVINYNNKAFTNL